MPPRKLLVADDSVTIQKVIRLALSNSPTGDTYEIHAVSDGDEAIQQIAVMRPDLVIIDIALPGKSAFEVKRFVEQGSDFAGVKFIVMSSAFAEVNEAQISAAKFHSRLTKPFSPANLRQCIQEALDASPSRSTLSAPSATGTFQPESDIRKLTESTLKMSGLGDLGNEAGPSDFSGLSGLDLLPDADAPDTHPRMEMQPEIELSAPPQPPQARRPAPPSPPPASDSIDDFGWSVTQGPIRDFSTGPASTPVPSAAAPRTPPPTPDAFPPEPALPPLSNLSDFGGSNFEFEKFRDRFEEAQPHEFADLELDKHITPPPAAAPLPRETSASAAAIGLDPELVEHLVRQEVQREVVRMLPDLAEKLLKQEIHKMLQHQP